MHTYKLFSDIAQMIQLKSPLSPFEMICFFKVVFGNTAVDDVCETKKALNKAVSRQGIIQNCALLYILYKAD